LVREIELLWPRLRAVVVLGGFGWVSLWPALRAAGVELPRRLPQFGHGVEVELGGRTVLGCYHVSQQNTFTGKLTEAMLDGVLGRAASLGER
jgi:uracil-DNA glycosylase